MSDSAKARMGCLVLVGTPIGNRGDLSPRAREAITQADHLLCEDTRSPLRLLGLSSGADSLPPRSSCFVGNEHGRLRWLENALREGKRIVFVSEAGMPVWSDPGRLLVDAAWAIGAPVDVVPGPTAAASALALSGFVAEGAVFTGFIDRSGPGRRAQLEQIVAQEGASIVYEAGNRCAAFLADLEGVMGSASHKRRVLIARELTKAHQELLRDTLSHLRSEVRSALRGEVCIVVEGTGPAAVTDEHDESQVIAREVFALMTDASLKPRARAKALAKLLGRPATELYAALTRD